MMLRRLSAAAFVILAMCGSAGADHAPAIVVPGKRGVPVIINGRDASGAVVIGDWGLTRPGAVPVTVIYPLVWEPPPLCPCDRRPRSHHLRSRRTAHPFYHFFPGGAIRPKVGRLEVVPPGPPKPAESYSRSWSTESEPVPAAIEPSPPTPVIIAPIVPGRRPSP